MSASEFRGLLLRSVLIASLFLMGSSQQQEQQHTDGNKDAEEEVGQYDYGGDEGGQSAYTDEGYEDDDGDDGEEEDYEGYDYDVEYEGEGVGVVVGEEDYYGGGEDEEGEEEEEEVLGAAEEELSSFVPEMISVPLSITAHVGDRLELPCSAKVGDTVQHVTIKKNPYHSGTI